MRKATKLELLQFIRDEEITGALALMEKFGYSRGGADSVLFWLKAQNLVINETRGQWEITDTGLRRLAYYGR